MRWKVLTVLMAAVFLGLLVHSALTADVAKYNGYVGGDFLWKEVRQLDGTTYHAPTYAKAESGYHYVSYTNEDMDFNSAQALRAILVNLADTTNYPHTATNKVILSSVDYAVAGTCTSDLVGAIKVGVLVDTNATNGDVEWLISDFFSCSDESGKYRMARKKPLVEQIDLTTANSTLTYAMTNCSMDESCVSDSDNWDNDQTKTSIGNIAATPGIGDLVFTYKPVSGDIVDDVFSLSIMYRTE